MELLISRLDHEVQQHSTTAEINALQQAKLAADGSASIANGSAMTATIPASLWQAAEKPKDFSDFREEKAPRLTSDVSAGQNSTQSAVKEVILKSTITSL